MRANSLIITIYGDSIAPHGGTVWLGSFIELVQPLGLNPRMVRTAVFWLTEQRWLVAERIGRRSYHGLTTMGRRRFEHAFRRIYQEPTQDWEGEWQIVFTSGAALTEFQRDAVRKELLWEGFGAIAPGVLAHPSADIDSLLDIIEGNAVQDKVVAMRAKSVGTLDNEALRSLVRACWKLEAIAQEYGRFKDRFLAVLHGLRASPSLDPQQCFVVQTMLLHEYRRVLLRDPQLPARLLPADWPGPAARELCRDLYRITHRAVQRHLLDVLETASGPLPQAAPYFFERFGGLDADDLIAAPAAAAFAQ